MFFNHFLRCCNSWSLVRKPKCLWFLFLSLNSEPILNRGNYCSSLLQHAVWGRKVRRMILILYQHLKRNSTMLRKSRITCSTLFHRSQIQTNSEHIQCQCNQQMVIVKSYRATNDAAVQVNHVEGAFQNYRFGLPTHLHYFTFNPVQMFSLVAPVILVADNGDSYVYRYICHS